MKSKDLIKRLQELDPDGETRVCVTDSKAIESVFKALMNHNGAGEYFDNGKLVFDKSETEYKIIIKTKNLEEMVCNNVDENKNFSFGNDIKFEGTITEQYKKYIEKLVLEYINKYKKIFKRV